MSKDPTSKSTSEDFPSENFEKVSEHNEGERLPKKTFYGEKQRSRKKEKTFHRKGSSERRRRAGETYQIQRGRVQGIKGGIM